MTMFKEMWFWGMIFGAITAAILGWTARFTVAEHGARRLQKRNNRGWRERIEGSISILVYVLIWSEIFIRAKYGLGEPWTLKILTEDAVYEVILYTTGYFAGYALLLLAIDTLADALHIGFFQLQRESETLRQLEDWLEDYYEIQAEGIYTSKPR